jgi:hypothetical protein
VAKVRVWAKVRTTAPPTLAIIAATTAGAPRRGPPSTIPGLALVSINIYFTTVGKKRRLTFDASDLINNYGMWSPNRISYSYFLEMGKFPPHLLWGSSIATNKTKQN